ncbi:UNVERIFIED_CONTAM: Glucan endo-1,3-beta-glucosidase, acidic isoform PR-Q', partial [Sesamum latifolium]
CSDRRLLRKTRDQSAFPSDVVALYNQNNIRRMRIYDPHQPTLQALRGSNIEVILGVPNTDLQYVAASQANANTWVQNNVQVHRCRKRSQPAERRHFSVRPVRPPGAAKRSERYFCSWPGEPNQSLHCHRDGRSWKRVSSGRRRVPARSRAISRRDHSFLVNNRPLYSSTYILTFLILAIKQQISLQYALFTSDGVVVPGGIRYQNLFYAILDAMYAALEKSGGSSLEIVVSESGWPSAGGDSTTIDNARTYNNNLIQRVKNGTPKRPGRAIETYIFAMFDENQKDPEFEKHFGIFSPDRRSKYPINFN